MCSDVQTGAANCWRRCFSAIEPPRAVSREEIGLIRSIYPTDRAMQDFFFDTFRKSGGGVEEDEEAPPAGGGEPVPA
jgi:hypothetical protein